VRDRAQLQNARRNLRRYQRLVAERLIAQQQVDEQRAVVGQYAGAVEIDQAQVQSAKLNIEYARITSPTDGVTGVRLIDSGNVVHAGDPNGIVVVTQLDPIAVLFSLPQNQLVDVSRQLSQGPLPVEAFSQDGQTRLSNTGHLELIDNQINPATATLRLKAVFANPERVLWPNQFVKVRLLLATDRGALVVPAAAIQHGPEGDFVYVVAGDQTAHVRRVQVKRTAGELAIVANGLQAGERVVTEGQNQLQPGSRVAVRTPGAGPNQASAPDHAPGQVQPQPRTQGRTPR
jgi:multidrug efflux system membrane fusion protein